MKNFIKAMNMDGERSVSKDKTPRISDTKLKEEIFEGHQIRKLMKITSFIIKLSKPEKILFEPSL